MISYLYFFYSTILGGGLALFRHYGKFYIDFPIGGRVYR